MQEAILKILLSAFTLGFALTASSPFALSQSQALNGQIEGAVFDQSNAPVSHAVVKLTNLETGFVGNITTDETGKYRFSLLPLGTYRITVEATTFKKLVREGVILSAGETATVDLPLEIGEISEVVNVLLDASIADPGKTDLGRVMNFREVQNLPLLSRNVYNFAFLQANVTGSPSRGNVPPTTNANGYLRRVNYLLDGNTNTQADRAGVRLMIISDVYVNEVQLITNGFAAEFGNTPGLIMNVVTPSGTNELAGTISYRFRRPSFYSRPFFYPAAELQPNNADYFSVTVGGPVIKDKWQFFFGHEGFTRDDKATAARLITVLPSVRDSLISAGVPALIFPAATPSFDRSAFYIFRTDLQLNNNNRAALRFNHSNINAKNYTPAGINTLDRGFDNRSRDFALAGQLISHSSGILNEFRFQYADRITANKRNEVSGTGPSIEIRGLANFGPPENLDTVLPLQKVKQIQNNISFIKGSHAIKLGGGINAINDLRQLAIVSKYTFSSVAAYVNARRGASEQHLRSYLTYSGTFGDTEIKYRSTFWNVFAQDAWKPTRRLKVSYGLRYDLYVIPEADATSPLLASRKFNLDKNNLAPRLGLAYAVRQGTKSTVLRAGVGLYYDTPWLNMYERALRNNGNSKYFNFSINGNNDGLVTANAAAPAFPNILTTGTAVASRNIDTIAPDFENMYAVHTNIQLEHSITDDLSLSVGYVHSGGRHIAVYRNINLVARDRLADGRPVFHTTARVDPRFNNIYMAEAAGVSGYDAFSLQLNRRFSRGVQVSASYTLSKSIDDAPEQNVATGNIQNLITTDPYNRSLDKGASFSDQRHTFVMSAVARSNFNPADRVFKYLVNNNQFGIIATANSGETFNIVAETDLNNDAIIGLDRPVGVKRNSGRTPPQFNVDLRYSRFFNFTDRYKLEAFGEFVNVFNINSIVGYTDVRVPTTGSGELIAELPDFRARNQSAAQESRQFQLGFKFIF